MEEEVNEDSLKNGAGKIEESEREVYVIMRQTEGRQGNLSRHVEGQRVFWISAYEDKQRGFWREQ